MWSARSIVIEEIARSHGYNKFANTLPAYSGAVIELATRDALMRTLRASVAGAGIQRGVVADIHLPRRCGEVLVGNAGAGTGESAERGSVGDADVAGARHARHAGMELESRTSRMRGCSKSAACTNFPMVSGLSRRRACLGATLASVRGALPVGGALDVSKGSMRQRQRHSADSRGTSRICWLRLEEKLATIVPTADYFHSGRSARALINGAPVVAQFGQIHPAVGGRAKVACRMCFWPNWISSICIRSDFARLSFMPLGKYPAVERDFSFVFNDDVTFTQMREDGYGSCRLLKSRCSSSRNIPRRIDCGGEVFGVVARPVPVCGADAARG